MILLYIAGTASKIRHLLLADFCPINYISKELNR